MRPTCNDCGTRLDGPVENDRTQCPQCGHWWTLSPDRRHIHITLEVHDVTTRLVSNLGGSHNG